MLHAFDHTVASCCDMLGVKNRTSAHDQVQHCCTNLAKRLQHHATSTKVAWKNLTIFKFEPTTLNRSQHVTTRRNLRVAKRTPHVAPTMLQYAVGRGLTSDLLINNRSSNYQTSSIVTGLNASTVNVVFLFLFELKLSSDVNKPESAVSKWYAWNRQCPTQTQCQSVRGSEPTVGFSFNILSCLKNLLLIILAWLHCKNFDPRSICKGLRALLPASSSRPFLIFSQYGQHCTLC